MNKLAYSNLKKLDHYHQQAYKKLLKEQDDILMSYLIAYESDAILQIANPKDVLSNYLQIRSYLNTYGTDLSPEFFLSYVAHQTVADERITPYRAEFLRDGLREVLQNSKNDLELYRAVSLWCVSRLKFQPTSGRDQAPLDITQKSYLGRCEEMQILYISAARTVGLPARPSYVPWWSHTDNNHAWAEVWIDGAWHYTGDMDAAYYPDQTWFSGLIDKTVLILSKGTLPDATDEVLIQGRYECVINSIPIYAKEHTRILKIKTLDEQDNPLPETTVGLLVFNSGTLRSLIYIQTDDEGEFELSVGRGAFYLVADNENKRAMALVPSSEDKELYYELTLQEGPLPDQDEMLFYPASDFTWKNPSEEWNNDVEQAKAKWNRREQRFQDRIFTYSDTLLGIVASSSRGNYNSLKGFWYRYPEPQKEFLNFLISEDFDPKFLWQASSEQIIALYNFFLKIDGQNMTSSELAPILAPTVFYEELPQPVKYKKGIPQLYPDSFYQKGNTPLERMNSASGWLAKHYKINSSKALSGLLPLDIAIKQKYLTPLQYRMMAVNIARANKVPAYFSRQPDLIFIQFDNGDWGYYDLKKNAPQVDSKDSTAYTKLIVSLSDENGVPITGLSDAVNLTRYQDGVFYWLDQVFSEDEPGLISISVPKDSYYLQAGYRVSDSQTAFQMKYLDLSETDSLFINIICRDYPRQWSENLPPELLSILEEIDSSRYQVILIGNYDQENSIRLAEKIRSSGKNFLWLGYEPSPQSIENYTFSRKWQMLVNLEAQNRFRTITLFKQDGIWQYFEGMWERLPD
ncbi:MAG TPA: transglutaminase domain-containing protein [Candidatus Syntrophosphaera thermopropionivorans]|nr:transglutaminase domain-containing protein [Candidatus Syntrophosphaera thermopropionivorans]